MLLAPAIPAPHSFLRQATQRLHRRIDRTSVLAVLASSGVTLELYGAAMQSLEQAYGEIDRWLLRNCGRCPAEVPPYTPRGPVIHRDLVALGIMSPDRSPQAGPQFALNVPDTEEAYLGMRYVVEGAQLGSRVIYGHLYAAFGVRLSEFGSFWMPGSALQGSWPLLLKNLARIESRPSLAAAAHSARLTFRYMGHYLAGSEKEGL
jgi:heme oxygenase